MPIISISSVSSENGIINILFSKVVVSSNSTSSPFISTKKSSSASPILASINSLGNVNDSFPGYMKEAHKLKLL